MQKEKMKRRRTALLLLFTALVLLMAAIAENVWPTASGKNVTQDLPLTVDWSNASDGYIMIKATKSEKRQKIRIKYGDNTLTYDYNGAGDYEVFPLQYGSGTYRVILYKNTTGSKYAEEGSVTFKATMTDEQAAFLCPNQYVNYTSSSKPVQDAATICAGLTSQKEKYDAICAYVTKNYTYDFIKSVTVKSGVLPDIDDTAKKHMGICQDLSALTVSMLRTQGIHAKLMIGYADENYHAWVVAVINGDEYMYDPTAAVGGINKVKSYNVERYY